MASPTKPSTVIYQAAKLGDIPYLLEDFALAQRIDAQDIPIGRIFGNSSGALVAVAHGIVLSARAHPDRFTPQATSALADFVDFFRRAKSRHLRRLNWRSLFYGFYNLDPLKRWLAARLRAYAGRDDLTLADLSVPVYLCVGDRDARPVFFGPPDDTLRADYHDCSTRFENAPILDACIAALSTLLSTDAHPVNGHYYKDGRPVFADISPMVLDMEAGDPRPIIKSRPYTPLPTWHSNAISQVFIMHRWHERNQALLAAHYVDLLGRHRALTAQADALLADLRGRKLDALADEHFADATCPRLLHVRLPYIGSTEAGTNMRQSIANKKELMQQFRELGEPQLEGFDFGRPITLIYGAGGFSGIAAGMTMTRLVDGKGADIRRIFGCSAGVLNGLFHGIVLAARRHPELYTAEAPQALQHLEAFFDGLTTDSLYRINKTPRKLARAAANAGPLRELLAGYIERWTGRPDGAAVTFEDIRLPFYAIGARGSDGGPDFFGIADDLEMRFGGRTIRPINCPIVDAIDGGMAQPFYITPPVIQGETYYDGGAAFYDIELFAAGMEQQLGSLVSIHVVGPPDYSFGFDERPTLLRIVFDTHNFTFPEERRRMTAIANLFYDHEALRRRLARLIEAIRQSGHGELLTGHPLPDLTGNWWRCWEPENIS
ncbi:MAG: patatin-like phospholipase family protein [Anaerolineae bacterium]|nr:patatin-like phospholipase family protein [Anaerolineae bacterium]